MVLIGIHKYQCINIFQLRLLNVLLYGIILERSSFTLNNLRHVIVSLFFSLIESNIVCDTLNCATEVDKELWIIYGNWELGKQKPRESCNREKDAFKWEEENKRDRTYGTNCNGTFITLISNIMQHIPFIVIVKWLSLNRKWLHHNVNIYHMHPINHLLSMKYAICVRVIDLMKVMNWCISRGTRSPSDKMISF